MSTKEGIEEFEKIRSRIDRINNTTHGLANGVMTDIQGALKLAGIPTQSESDRDSNLREAYKKIWHADQKLGELRNRGMPDELWLECCRVADVDNLPQTNLDEWAKLKVWLGDWARCTAITPGSVEVSLPMQRFAVALSFPGEKRDYVEAVDVCLTKTLPTESVFYDNRFKAELARPNLDTHLQDIYSNAELVVVFLCADYQRKQWCGLEWRAIRAMIKKRLDAKIMPFRFGNATVYGIFDIDGYIDAQTHSPEEAAKLILQRLGSNRRQARGPRNRKPRGH